MLPVAPLLFLIVLLLLAREAYRYLTGKPTTKFPPGPWRLPVLGGYTNILLEDANFQHIALEKMSIKYKSPVIGMYLADKPMVVANSYDTCKELFNRPEFQARGYGLMAKTRTNGVKSGIFANDGDDWSYHKRFSLRKMRDLGFGKRSAGVENVLEQELSDFVDEIKVMAVKDQDVEIPEIFYPIMLNCIYQLVLGKRLPVTQRNELKEFGRLLMRFQNSTHPLGKWLSFFPKTAQSLPKVTKWAEFVETSMAQWYFLQREVEQHKASFDSEACRDFIDFYLQSMKKSTELSEQNLIMCSIDFIFPAVASASAVGILIMYLLQHPEVVNKCQAEIDSVVGRGRLPNLNDRQMMPYLEATIREGFRIMPTLPLSVIHRSTQEAEYFKYNLPANTLMLANIYAMHRDEKLWTDPSVFRPERFLDSSGHLLKKDHSIPFGLGKRVCVGETFARQHIFTTTAAVLQNCNLHQLTPVDFTQLKAGFILNPPSDFKLRLSLRD